MIRTPEEFQAQAETIGLTRWEMHNCSICGYPCAFLFRGGKVFFDGSCWCSTESSPPSPRSWADVAEHYNRNQPEQNPRITAEWVASVDALWGWNATVAADSTADL